MAKKDESVQYIMASTTEISTRKFVALIKKCNLQSL